MITSGSGAYGAMQLTLVSPMDAYGAIGCPLRGGAATVLDRAEHAGLIEQPERAGFRDAHAASRPTAIRKS